MNKPETIWNVVCGYLQTAGKVVRIGLEYCRTNLFTKERADAVKRKWNETAGKLKESKNRPAVIAGAAAAGLLLLYLILRAGTAIHPAEDTMIAVYGSPGEGIPSVKASLFGIDVSDSVEIDDRTDYEKIGTYDVYYRYRMLGIPLKTVGIKSVVADMDAPVIDLDDGSVCFSKLNEEWVFPSYVVHDNCDPDESLQITFEGNVDASKRGTYDGRVKACDLSGNCAVRSLKVVVGDVSDRDFLPENFDLEALDRNHYLLMPGTGPASDKVFHEIYWIGDSNIRNLADYDGLPSDRVIARYAMAPSSFDLPVYYNNKEQKQSAAELVKEIQPKRILIMMGEAEAGNGDPIHLAEEYGKCLDLLHEACPTAEIYVSAILPIRKGSTEAAATQEEINRANYCLLEMCRQKKIPMLCADNWLKDDTGYGIPSYYLEDGLHLKAANFPAYLDYVSYCLAD